MGFRCAACDGPGARLDAGRRAALCARCEHPTRSGRDPVRLGDILTATGDALTFATRTAAAAPGSATCHECGSTAERHRTAHGRWILIEPGALAAAAVPVGHRWRIAGDGTAVGLRSAAPSGTCRISHLDVCPARPAPAHSPALHAVWRRNARQGV
ncbi:DUF6083 domain-containing protein [Streptomyces pristinaespiralis]|uniref:Uncharacterized protein n=2 Tax=Streptomyces pristinaespiralis TaxID=38300 RepID=B5HBR6_STRE2|nr:DUF6083 domain-containing protein [Streptomyces pristinaespiralis]ALC23537.1 hypothetical protein SPRI_5231 [Streptomyces pristinaespiralis]EDY64277.1 conserved hypothetical protein [Streptomyces pristinaespiralis ATCC 25486]QMU14002.1 hypothetical protein H3L99_10620 [Streptomyces pristinaespiralis]